MDIIDRRWLMISWGSILTNMLRMSHNRRESRSQPAGIKEQQRDINSLLNWEIR
jgi:hypothetical protein